MGNTAVLMYGGGTKYTSEEFSSFLSCQNEFLASFKLGGEVPMNSSVY